jgi:hypothetical protein
MFEIFMLEIPQMDYLLDLFGNGPHVELLKTALVYNYHAFEALR